MITYKPIIIQGGRRRDGTWPVYIRVTYKGVSRRLQTTLSCTAEDLTRTGKIKNATILERGQGICAQMREACASLSPFVIQDWTVDDVVAHIRSQLVGRSFALDFFQFADGIVEKLKPNTRGNYTTALHALEAFLGSRALDVNDISKAMLREFAGSCRSEAVAARHLVKLHRIFEEAKRLYNDEDSGVIVIPRSPFTDLPKKQIVGKAQKAQPLEILQQIIDARPDNLWDELALHALLLSFCTMGANMADLYAARPFEGDVWIYCRKKTGTEARVRLEAPARKYAALLGAGTSSEWWLPALHRYKTPESCTFCVNKWLHRWQEQQGLPSFSFYSMRKSWGTWGRKLGIEKATIDEGLAHKGDWQLTDIYAERNWELAWEANRRVLALLDWGLQEGTSERSQQPR